MYTCTYTHIKCATNIANTQVSAKTLSDRLVATWRCNQCLCVALAISVQGVLLNSIRIEQKIAKNHPEPFPHLSCFHRRCLWLQLRQNRFFGQTPCSSYVTRPSQHHCVGRTSSLPFWYLDCLSYIMAGDVGLTNPMCAPRGRGDACSTGCV